MKYEDKKERLEEIAEIIKKYPEALQSKVFDYLINEHIQVVDQTLIENNKEANMEIQTRQNIKKTTSKKSAKTAPQILRDLNLRPNDRKTLAEFFEEKKPSGNINSTATMVYYLSEVLKESDITPNHIFSCYRELGTKIPANLEQNLRDCASSRYGYIDYKDNKCKTNIRGINFVEQDLPQKKK